MVKWTLNIARRRSKINLSKKKPEFGDNNILRLAVELGSQLEKLDWPYCIIGGVAVQRWGDPRQTSDVDGMVFAGFGREKIIAAQLLELYESRVENPIEFSVQARIVLLQNDVGTGIDLSLGGLPFERRVVERATFWTVPRHGRILTCTADDLVVLKAFAARPLDWIDVERILMRQGDKLDRKLILEELAELVELKEEPEIMETLTVLFKKHK